MKFKKLKKIIHLVLAAGLIVTSIPYSNTVFAADAPVPVLSVNFDDGTANDISGNENHGTVIGNPEFVERKSGKAIHLVNSANRTDEARQYVNFGQPDDLKFGDGDFTVMFWYKADPAKTTEGAVINNKYWVSGGNPGFTIGDMKEGITLNITAEQGGRADTSRDATATDNTWHHVAAVIDRTGEKKMTLFVDGTKKQSKDISNMSGSVDVADFLLGASNRAGNTPNLAVVDSYIDDLQVYKSALKKEQIIEAGVQPKMVLNVSFDNETAEDMSGNANHGIVIGTPEFTEGVSGKAIHLVNPAEREDLAFQYVNFGQPDDLKFESGSFSVMFWYKAEANIQTEGAIIGNKHWISGANPGFTIGDMREGITLNINTPGNSRKDTGRYSVATDGTWHHVAAVIDRTDAKKMTLFIDGRAEDPTDISDQTGSIDVSDFILGASNKEDGTKFLAVADAHIDELSVYNYAIPEDLIKKTVEKYGVKLELIKLKQQVSMMAEGERYTSAAIREMQKRIQEAERSVEEENADQDAILAAVNDDYKEFMEGAPAKMSFHLISDTHITSDPNGEAAASFKAVLQDMKEVNPNASALLTAGDNTQDGRTEEMKVFYDILEAFNPVEAGQTMIALGNHDMRGPDWGIWESFPAGVNAYYETIYNSYMQYNQKYMPDTDGAPYYDRWISGYHFIVLNSENSPKDTAWLSDTQLEWLEEKLTEKEDLSVPAFVIVHQALNDTHRDSNNYNGFGNQDAKVKEILSKHPQTVFISGHIHNGLGTAEVLDSPYGTLVDVPSLRYNHNGITGDGTGYEAYLYDTELYLRARDFKNQKWLPQCDVSVSLPALPVLCKQAEVLMTEEIYTEDSMAVLKKILPDAQNMLALGYGNYGSQMRLEINRVQQKLESAIESLEIDQDKEAAYKVIAQIAELGTISLESKAAILEAREAYESLSSKGKDFVTNLKDLIAAEERLAVLEDEREQTDKAGLAAVAELADKILEKEDQYTADYINNLKNATEEAGNVLKETGISKDIIDRTHNKMKEVLVQMELRGSKAELQAVIKHAETILGQSDRYSEHTLEELEGVLTEAKKVDADRDAQQDEIAKELLALINECLKVRMPGITDQNDHNNITDSKEQIRSADVKGSLNLAIVMAEKMEKRQNEHQCYMKESWNAAAKILAEARELQKKDEITQKEADEMFVNLISACSLVENGVQKEGLKAAISGTLGILADEDELAGYDETGVEAVRKVLAAAQNVYDKDNSSQEAVNAVILQLLNTVADMTAKSVKIVFENETEQLVIGQEKRLKVTISPVEADGVDAITWTSSDKEILTVDKTGKIKAMWPGDAVVTASIGEVSAAVKVTVEGVEKIYPDVKTEDWYYDAANWAFINDIISGYHDGTFGAADKLSRAQFAMILYRAAGEPETEAVSAFQDVAKGDWYYDAVIWANENKIVTGYEGGKIFGAADPITREQLATILYRYAKSQGFDVGVAEELPAFPDETMVSQFAGDAMKWVVSQGIIKGDQGKLNPQGSTKRAEAATIMYRYKKKIEIKK